MYRILSSFLFLFPPEWVHYFSMNVLKLLCRIGFKGLIKSSFSPGSMVNPSTAAQDQWSMAGLKFKNPVGLGAGFDKNAKYLRELECLGFGFVEIGTVTPLSQAGNDKPRLFRLPKDKALINRMGFNNDGVKVVAERLKKWRERQQSAVNSRQPAVASRQSAVGSRQSDFLNTQGPNPQSEIYNLKLIIGGNIGKNKSTPNDDAWKDYVICLKELHPYVDYFVVNVSSPNTPGLRALQEKESLRKILSHLQLVNNTFSKSKPLLLKISPDLSVEELDDIIDLVLEIKLDGLVAANTTTSRSGLRTHDTRLRSIGSGGLSGLPIKTRSTEMLRYICKKTNGQIPVMASGGIFTGEDAKEKLEAGAKLVQVWTGFIYEGPAIVKKICKSI